MVRPVGLLAREGCDMHLESERPPSEVSATAACLVARHGPEEFRSSLSAGERPRH